jgi:type III pantothenate kinase
MRTFYLDIGNSFLKIAEKTGEEWVINHQSEIKSVSDLQKSVPGKGDSVTIVMSSVRRDILRDIQAQLPETEIRIISSSLIPDKHLDYDTPETLGIDRFLVCLGACNRSSNDVIVIDAGSACTIDLMKSDKVYKGGVIMPGLELFHKSMRSYLPELPDVDRDLPVSWPGKSTKECIEWGINGSYLMAIGSFLNKYKTELVKADIFITGGDSVFIYESLKDEIPMNHNPYLVFDGMVAFEKMLNETGTA